VQANTIARSSSAILKQRGSSRSTRSSRLARLARLARQSRTCRVESSRAKWNLGLTVCLDGWSMINLSASYLEICVCFYDLISAKIRNFVLQISQIQHLIQQLCSCCRIEWEIFANRVLMTVSDNGLNHWRTQRGARRFNRPIESSEIFLNCVFAKYTIQTLLLYSLNPKFSAEKKH